jgi:hypothetical protein
MDEEPFLSRLPATALAYRYFARSESQELAAVENSRMPNPLTRRV